MKKLDNITSDVSQIKEEVKELKESKLKDNQKISEIEQNLSTAYDLFKLSDKLIQKKHISSPVTLEIDNLQNTDSIQCTYIYQYYNST